jgi:ADP-ribose pyrophosphatase YjhB (NUDIX family)
MSHGPTADQYRFCPKCGGGLGLKLIKEGEPPRLVCDRCGFVFYLDPKVSACTICIVDGGIVLLRRSIEPQLGKWVFPGGFVDRGETAPDAAIRETQEEVNLRVTLTGILDAYSFPGSDVVVIVYAADVVGGTLEARDESLEVRAFPPEALPWDELAFATTRAALRDYIHRFFPRVRAPR